MGSGNEKGNWYEVRVKFEVTLTNGQSFIEHTLRFWESKGKYSWDQRERAAIRAGMELAGHQGELTQASVVEMSESMVSEAGLDASGPCLEGEQDSRLVNDERDSHLMNGRGAPLQLTGPRD